MSKFKAILGESKALLKMMALIERVAPSKTNVLIIGESGTGKELVARHLHELSPLKGKPFIAVNCGAIPETLIESELFGHKRGSFTGAIADKPGLFEAASGGSIFLDEIGELPLSMQVKLLRVLQERTVRRVGSNDDVKLDVRVIAATNRNLEAGIKNGTFREDLYYRLNVIQIKTPPLRERKGDIVLLAERFIDRAAERQKKVLRGLSPAALVAIQAYGWPGNIRELENAIERAVTMENSDEIHLEALPGYLTPFGSPVALSTSVEAISLLPDFSAGSLDLDGILEAVARAYINAALQHAAGDTKKAASLLGITEKKLTGLKK